MIIVRHGEIYTKSPPVRRQFIAKLASNIRSALPDARVVSKRWRLLVYAKDEDEAAGKLRDIFGIVSFSKCIETDSSLASIKKAVESVIPLIRGRTFAVRARRLSKEGPESQQINETIGDLVRKKAKAKVNLGNPEITLGIEVYEGKAYIFTDTCAGSGGLPLGTAGRMVLLRSENSALAAWMISKRGIEVVGMASTPLGYVTGETDVERFIAQSRGRKLPIYAPLMGFNKKELEELKKKVG